MEDVKSSLFEIGEDLIFECALLQLRCHMIFLFSLEFYLSKFDIYVYVIKYRKTEYTFEKITENRIKPHKKVKNPF